MRSEGKWFNGLWQIDTATGNGSTTVYALSVLPADPVELDVTENGLTSVYTVHHTVSGLNVTFTTAPAAGTNIVFRYLKKEA